MTQDILLFGRQFPGGVAEDRRFHLFENEHEGLVRGIFDGGLSQWIRPRLRLQDQTALTRDVLLHGPHFPSNVAIDRRFHLFENEHEGLVQRFI